MYNDNMKFTITHEWVRVINDNQVEIGITNHAQELLGDIVFVELPKVGKQIKASEAIGVIESVKSASDLYAPVSGEVIEVNPGVLANSAIINSDPHIEGWLFKVNLSDTQELSKLLSADDYQKLINA